MREKLKKHRYLLIGIPVIALVALLANSSSVDLDNLKAYIALSPDKVSVATKDIFSVVVSIGATEDFNAVEATVEFPTETLEVESASFEDSIINFWIEEPAFSNEDGTLKFSGIITNPGHTGKGNILKINFKTKKSGIANVNFSHASVLANDGKASEILEGKFGAVYSIKAVESPSFDFNHDGKLNVADISLFISKLNDSTAVDTYDLNMDGKVNLQDLSVLLSRTSKR